MPADAAVALLQDLIALSDEPCFDAVDFRTLAASRLARCHGVTVMLASDGADEVFAGCDGYQGASAKRPRPWRRLQNALGAGHSDSLETHLSRAGAFGGLDAAALLRGAPPFEPTRLLRRFDPASLPRVTRLQLADLRTSLVDDVLFQIDRASMACGVEIRLPFLDHELVEAAFTIDSRVLFADGELLALLKRAAASWLPPEVLVDRRRAPDATGGAGLEAAWQARAASLLPDGVLVSRGLLHRDALLNVLASKRPPAIRLLVGAELWARQWLEPSSGAA